MIARATHTRPATPISELEKPWRWEKYIQADNAKLVAEKRAYAQRYGVVAVLFTPQEVVERTAELGQLQIARIESQTPADRTYIYVENGGTPFAVDLGRAIDRQSPDTMFMSRGIDVSRYGDSQTGKERLIIHRDTSPLNIADKDVTAVDEVCDLAKTLCFLGNRFGKKGVRKGGKLHIAKSVNALALCDKELSKPDDLEVFDAVDIGLIIPQVWGSGMGMDSKNEKYRFTEAVMVSRAQKPEYFPLMEELLTQLGDVAIFGMDDLIRVA